MSGETVRANPLLHVEQPLSVEVLLAQIKAFSGSKHRMSLAGFRAQSLDE